MVGLFKRLIHPEPKSAQQAKERLRMVIIQDRTDLNPGLLDILKDDLIAAVSRHVEIDSSAVRVIMTQQGREQRLIADIPLRASRRRRLG